MSDKILPERENVTVEIAEFAEVMQLGAGELTAEIAEIAEVRRLNPPLCALRALCGECLGVERRDADAQP